MSGEGAVADMADEQPAGTARADGSPRSPIVFVSDASAETERIGDALRAIGYVVADVPISLLSSRVAAQRPHVVLLDVDADGVLEELARLRKLPGSGAIDFVYVGAGDGIVKNADDALSNDGSAFFLRPVDVAGLIRKIEALTGGAVANPSSSSTPPPSLPPSRGLAYPPRDEPPSSDRPSLRSLPAPGARTPGPPLPMSTTSLGDLLDAPRSFASFGTVSDELQQLLADAELRAEVHAGPENAVPSPEEEIEAVLPADVLASLDEPIDADEDEEPAVEAVRMAADVAGAHAKGTTAGGSRHPTTGAGGRSGGTGAQTNERRLASETPVLMGTSGAGTTSAPGSVSFAPRSDASPTFAPPPRTEHPSDRNDVPRAESNTRSDYSPPPRPRSDYSPPPRLRSDDSPPPRLRSDDSPQSRLPSDDSSPPRPSSWHPPPAFGAAPSPREPLRVASVQSPNAAAGVVVLGPAEARRFFAEAISRRASGALCFESEGIVRRVVIRDGDLVAAASGGEHESLVHFLAARGELLRDEVPRLAAKIPPYGRHAGAALVAHGFLRQDQLWVVLRAHAEWIASAILRLARGSAQLEPEPPGRLRNEPSVFGAATGAEIFVELVRRAVPVDEAIERLGGEATRIADGVNVGLLAECNFSPHDLDLLHRARGGTIADLLARAADGEILAVLHALSLLGIIEAVPAPEFGRRDARGRPAPETSALDDDAMRASVRARLELVEEGDYFSVLGVTRDATGYEVRRAFVELRRAFEPSRILTPRLLDLADDVRKIVVVLEEAYDILRDSARRERYRRAIDARPE